ncbi:MAG: TolC family protein [Pseudomonadota bacterium]
MAAAAVVFPAHALAEEPAALPLRGALVDGNPHTRASSQIQGPSTSHNGHGLRGSGAHTDTKPSLRSEIVGALRTSRLGLAPLTQFPGTLRGTGSVLRDRDVPLVVPERPSLRHAMMRGELRHSDQLSTGRVGGAVALALRGSYANRALLERAQADRARVRVAAGAFLPKLMLSLDGNHTVRQSETQPDQTVNGEVQLSLSLYSSGAKRNAVYQAQSLSLASDYAYLAGEHKVALEAIAAHINLRLNRAVERALDKNVRAMQRLVHIARRRYEAGDATRTDIAIAQGNLEGAKAELDIARKNSREIAADYKTIVGRRAPARLAVAHADGLVPPTIEAAVALARKHNPVLKAAFHSADASAYAARAEKGRFGPKVDLYGGYTHEMHTNATTPTEPEWNVGVRLRVPLVDFTATPSVAAARHDALEAGYRALDQEKRMIKAITRKHIAYKSALRRSRISARQVKAVARSVTGTRREYQAGFRSITDVTNGQIKLTRARITQITALHERMLCGYELAFATGHPDTARLALD